MFGAPSFVVIKLGAGNSTLNYDYLPAIEELKALHKQAQKDTDQRAKDQVDEGVSGL